MSIREHCVQSCGSECGLTESRSIFEQCLQASVGKTIASTSVMCLEGDPGICQINFTDGTYLRLAIDYEDVDVYVSEDSREILGVTEEE